ncbi:hypothetical protein [Haloarcula laminariae]|uniref:hypothetical protein n=1 Tax=Haloarcula laminariae TaxID=2961577 RepID=UPI00240772B2|nr:hypothetical protein [Halomicroarcula sp. FL173]
MSQTGMSTNGRVVDDDADKTASAEQLAELRTQVELLTEENDRLRDSYTRAKQTQYRRSALGLLAVGTVAALGGLFVPTASTVLFALAGSGLFGGVLTYYLTPEQFISADVGRDVYAMLAANEAALVSELGLSSERVYVPVSAGSDSVRLFVPHDTEYVLPSESALAEQTLLADEAEQRGLALDPSGTRLLASLESTLRGSLADSPSDLASQLSDALVEQFELVDAAEPDIDSESGRCSVAIRDSVYGPIDQFDHPVVSLLAAGFAAGLAVPVTTSVSGETEDAQDVVVTLRWDAD